jgi:outer membrane protein TolC
LGQLFSAADSLSPELAEARLNVARALADRQAARGMPNPTLFGNRESLSDGQVEEEEQTYGIRQSIGYLWSYFPKRTATRGAYESARATFEEARRQLGVELADRALTARALRQQIVLMDTVLFHATRAVQSMEARFRLGDVSEYDLHRLQAELLRLHQQRFTLLREQQQAGAEFTRLSGLPDRFLDDLTISVPVPPDFLSVDQAVEVALRQRPLLKARMWATAAAEKAYDASRWNQLPDVAVGIGRKTVEPGFTGITLEAELEIPLFAQRRSQRSFAKTTWNQSRIQLEAAQLQVEQEARAAYQLWRELTTETASTVAFDSDQARLDLNRGVQMYLQGELSPVEVVDILRSTLESMDAYLQLSNSRVLADLELRRVTGLPLLEER